VSLLLLLLAKNADAIENDVAEKRRDFVRDGGSRLAS
jgi:hypothetical protein